MEDDLKKQSEKTLQGAPTIELASERKPEPLVVGEPYDPSIGTPVTTEQTKKDFTQKIGIESSKAAILNRTSEVPYSGGSTIPGQEVSARLRDYSGSEGNPFYLESENRYVPVKPYQIFLPSIQKEFTVDSVDPQKIAYTLATLYQGVPKSNFVGYQYVGPEIQETMWDRSTWAKMWKTLGPTSKKFGKMIVGGIGKTAGDVITAFESIPDVVKAVSESPEAKSQFAELGKLSMLDVVRKQSESGMSLKDIAGKSVQEISDTTVGKIEDAEEVRKAIEREIGADLAIKTINGIAQKSDRYFGTSLWNESERYIKGAIAEAEEALKDNQLINPTLGAEVVTAVPQSIVAMAPTLAFGPVWGPLLRSFAYYESILHSLMDKGMTYEEAAGEARVGAGLSTVIEAGTSLVGSLLAQQFIKDYAAHTIGQAVRNGVISYAAHAPLEVVGETYQEKVESYFSQDAGLETFSEFTRQDVITALAALVGDMPEVTTSSVRSYIEGRADLKTVEKRKEYDEKFRSTLGELVAHGDAYRKVFMQLGFTEEQADMMVMQAQATGKESLEHYLADAMHGQLDRLMNGEIKEVIDGTVQTLAPASKDPMVFAKEEYEKLDQLIDKELDNIQHDDITETDRNIIKALFRVVATEWAYRTGNMVSDFDLPKFHTKVFFSNTSAESDSLFYKDTGARFYHGINLSATISRDIGLAVSKSFEDFSSMKPQQITAGTALIHEIIHDVLDTFVRDNDIDAQSFREFIHTMNEHGLKKAYDKKSTNGSLNKLGSEMAIDYAQNNPDKIREDIKFGKNLGEYNNPKSFTEYAAQATGFLGKDTPQMLGMGTSKSWAFLSKLNRLLSAINDVTPLSKGIQNWIEEFEKFVKDNSKQLSELVNEKGSKNLKAALQALLSGNEDAINWKGITWENLKELTDLVGKPLDATGMAIAQDILDQFSKDDIAELTRKLWESAYAIDEEDEIVPNAAGTTNVSDTETDLDTETIEELEDYINAELSLNTVGLSKDPGDIAREAEDGSKFSQQSYLQNNIINALAAKAQEVQKPKSGFEKQLERQVSGRTLQQDLEEMTATVRNTPRKRGLAAWLSERRGLLGPLFSLGGMKAVRHFDFHGKYQAFRDIYTSRMTAFKDKVISELFGGDSLQYSKYITNFMARNIDTKVYDPNTHQERDIKVSKDMIAQAMLSYAQQESNGPIRTLATYPDYNNLIKNMDETDVKFVEMMRDNLKQVSLKSFKKERAESVGRVLKNYFPLVSWHAVSEDRAASTLSFFSRKDTTSPIGVIGAIEVFGRYHGRLAGADSEYFQTIKRLGEMLDFPKYASKDGMDEQVAREYASKSREFRELVISQIGTRGLRSIEGFIDYVKEGSMTNDVSKDFLGKLSRTISPALLGGKLKNFFTNITQGAYWMGAPVEDTSKYWAEIAGVLSTAPSKVYDEFMKIGEGRTGIGFFKSRKDNRALAEFVAKSAGPADESLIKDFATFLQSKNLTDLSDISTAVAWLSERAGKILMGPSILGDVVGNMYFAVAYNRRLFEENLNRGMSKESAKLDADNKTIEFVLARESSTNQAVKPLTVLRWNRDNPVVASIAQFTGETVSSWGAAGQAWQGYRMGEFTLGDAAKDILGIMSGHLAYRAIQSGLFGAAFSAMLGELDDEEKEFVWSSFADQLVQEVIDAAAGPTSAIWTPVVLGFLNDRTYGLSIPVVSEVQELLGSVKDLAVAGIGDKTVETDDVVRAIAAPAALANAFPGIENAINSARGAYLSVFGDTEDERKKGRYMAAGRTEKFAEKAAGIKKSKNKKVDKNSALK